MTFRDPDNSSHIHDELTLNTYYLHLGVNVFRRPHYRFKEYQ